MNRKELLNKLVSLGISEKETEDLKQEEMRKRRRMMRRKSWEMRPEVEE